MTTTITITDVNAVLGIIFGLSGLFIGLFSYSRDKPKVKVHLQWEMQDLGDMGKKVGMVTVANVGRRPIYLSHVTLKMPHYFAWPNMILKEGIAGNRLAEGDHPITFIVSHDEMVTKLGEELQIVNCPNVWKKIRVQVSDSAGKKYYSSKIKKEPSWSLDLKSKLALNPSTKKKRTA